MSDRTEQPFPEFREKEAIEFRLIFAVAFIAFLLEAVGRRVLMRGARMSSQSGGYKSVIAEAKAAAHRCVPFAFMG